MANIFHIDRPTNKITLGTTNTTINIASHTASQSLALDASKNLESIDLSAVYQPLDDVLTDLAALAVVADNEFIVGTGAGTYAHESGVTVRTSIGLGTGDSPTFAGLIISGAISSGTSTFSTEGPTDNVDVSGVNTLFLDCSANDVTIGGFTGGVNGQVLYVARLCAGAFSGILEHIEGGGSQDICLHAGADETLDTEYGGWILICNGTSWFDTSHAKHV